jgi:hypothetical protein
VDKIKFVIGEDVQVPETVTLWHKPAPGLKAETVIEAGTVGRVVNVTLSKKAWGNTAVYFKGIGTFWFDQDALERVAEVVS